MQFFIEYCSNLDGNYLALGSRDNNIYIYQVSESGRKYTKIGRCSVCALSLIQYTVRVLCNCVLLSSSHRLTLFTL